MTNEYEPQDFTCEHCGIHDPYDVEYVENPFNQAMGGLTHMEWICKRCYREEENQI